MYAVKSRLWCFVTVWVTHCMMQQKSDVLRWENLRGLCRQVPVISGEIIGGFIYRVRRDPWSWLELTAFLKHVSYIFSRLVSGSSILFIRGDLRLCEVKCGTGQARMRGTQRRNSCWKTWHYTEEVTPLASKWNLRARRKSSGQRSKYLAVNTIFPRKE